MKGGCVISVAWGGIFYMDTDFDPELNYLWVGGARGH